ncbi:MAG: DUF983 domain-containing protein [Fulvivirga sp.]
MSKLKAVISGKCPQCRKGDMFESNALSLSNFHKMHTHCTNCGLKYKREPGFFRGAMYVNYAVSVAIIIATGIALNVFDIYSIYNFLFIAVGVTVLLLPYLFRYSRIIYLHLFGGVDFKPDQVNQSKA